MIRLRCEGPILSHSAPQSTSPKLYQIVTFPPSFQSQSSGRGVEHPLQIAVHPQDVAVGEEHVHRRDAQDLAHEEASLRPKVSV